MRKFKFVAITLAVLAYSSATYAVPNLPPLDTPRRMELSVPKRTNLLTCIPASDMGAIINEVKAPPSALTLRGAMSERAPSLTVFRFGGSRGLELMTPLKWAPCIPLPN